MTYKRLLLITLNKNALIHLARLLDNPDSVADNSMTSIFKLKFNSLAPFEKTGFVTSWSKGCHVMLGMNFPKSLWNPLLGTFCVIKKDLYILSVGGGGGGGGLFSLSNHICLNVPGWSKSGSSVILYPAALKCYNLLSLVWIVILWIVNFAGIIN